MECPKARVNGDSWPFAHLRGWRGRGGEPTVPRQRQVRDDLPVAGTDRPEKATMGDGGRGGDSAGRWRWGGLLLLVGVLVLLGRSLLAATGRG
jgi:hypothetical protein